MAHIRQAAQADACRLAEIEIFNYRLNFYPIFRNDGYYFGELQVTALITSWLADDALLDNTWVYDDGVVKGFVRVAGNEIQKLFVEPALQGQHIGEALLAFAVEERCAAWLWALEKNERAIRFYGRHGFTPTGEWKLEEDTDEYLIRLAKQ